LSTSAGGIRDLAARQSDHHLSVAKGAERLYASSDHMTAGAGMLDQKVLDAYRARRRMA
jgi:hypothetical protein